MSQTARKAEHHAPAAKKAAQAEAAAQPPVNEKVAAAHTQQVGEMKEAHGQTPQPSSFLQILRAEIARVMPKTLGDTEKFMDDDQKTQMKGALTGNVNHQKQAATSEMQSATEAPPDTSAVPGKVVTPLPSEGPTPMPHRFGAGNAMPEPKPESEVSLQASKVEAADTLKENQLTPEQLRKANDPRFTHVLTAKQAVEEQADSSPKQYRITEKHSLHAAVVVAVSQEGKSLAGMHGVAVKTAGSVKHHQLTAKGKDELERKKVTDNIERIFARTKQAVEQKLASLETDVSTMFDRGVNAAIASMKAYVNQRLDDYKDKRYSGINFWKWAKDKLLGLPDAVKAFYVEGRKLFIKELDALIVAVATLVDGRLKDAKNIIASGQKEISVYVSGLPKHLQTVGHTAEREMAARFDELRQSVDDKKNELAHKLAQQYKEAVGKADAALKEIQDENKGLVTKLKEYVGQVIRILRAFKQKIMGMIKQGQAAIALIVSDPIGFLKNLLSAIKQGLHRFVANIWTHLKQGFLSWLFGSLASAGVTIPSDFSLGSIFKLVLQVLGFTYARIRAKAVKLIGERNVELLEKAWELIHALLVGGGAALWEKVKEFLGDLKSLIISAIEEWVVTSIIKAAVMKLATMFNPVGAIIQAIITIYNTVMFLIERINQILEFVQAVLNSIYKIATGALGAAAAWIEAALARTIPLIISFLARLLGLSGIADKIKSIIHKVQSTVDKALDKLIAKIVGGIGKAIGGLGKLFGKSEPAKDAKKDDKPADKWDIAAAGVRAEVKLMEAKGVSGEEIEQAIPGWKKRFGFKTLAVSSKSGIYKITGSMSPDREIVEVPQDGSEEHPFELDWPKPASIDYPTIYLGGETKDAVKQEDLKNKRITTVGGKKVEAYEPHGGKSLPGGELGLGEPLKLNDVVGPLTANPPKRVKSTALNETLKKYGYRPKAEKLDADHIRELQFGGKDAFSNLWPLDKHINRASGSILKNENVHAPGKKHPLSMAELKKDTKRKYWFRIVKFDYGKQH